MKSGAVAVDDSFRILGEYQNKTRPNQPKGVGDAFLKWLLQNKANTSRVHLISITETPQDQFAEFPDRALQPYFDASDRKFVAVAHAHPAKPAIWWVLFDIYDKVERRFWSTPRRDAWATATRTSMIVPIMLGRTDFAELTTMLATSESRYRDGPMEGVVVRAEEEEWLITRAKLVRSDFTQRIDAHWRSRPFDPNRLGRRA